MIPSIVFTYRFLASNSSLNLRAFLFMPKCDGCHKVEVFSKRVGRYIASAVVSRAEFSLLSRDCLYGMNRRGGISCVFLAVPSRGPTTLNDSESSRFTYADH